RSVSPVFDILLKSPTRPGWWAIQLKDYGIVLERDVEYRWYVSIPTVSNDLSHEIVVGGVIERHFDDLDCFLEGQPCDKEAMRVYLKSGIWYDGFACLNELIEANPQDPSLRRMRSALLKEVGIILPTAN